MSDAKESKKGRRGGPTSKLEAHLHLLPTHSDAQVAALAGVTKHAVYMYRRRHGMVPTDAAGEPRRRGRAAAAPKPEKAPKAAKAPKAPKAPKAAEAAAAPAAPSGAIADRLAQYKDVLASLPDGVVAQAAGVSKATLREYRLSLGIHKKPGRPSADLNTDIARFLGSASAPPPMAAEPVAAKRRGRPPKAAQAAAPAPAPAAAAPAAPKAPVAKAAPAAAPAAPKGDRWGWRITLADSKGNESDVVAAGASMAEAVAAASGHGTVISAARLARFVG